MLLPIAFVLVIAGFGIARPDTFFQWSNFTSIFGLNAPTLVLVMALLIPLTNGDLDLSIAELFGMITILVGWLNVNQHWGDRAGDPRRARGRPALRGDHRRDHRPLRRQPADHHAGDGQHLRRHRLLAARPAVDPGDLTQADGLDCAASPARHPAGFLVRDRDHADYVLRAHVHTVRAALAVRRSVA